MAQIAVPERRLIRKPLWPIDCSPVHLPRTRAKFIITSASRLPESCHRNFFACDCLRFLLSLLLLSTVSELRIPSPIPSIDEGETKCASAPATSLSAGTSLVTTGTPAASASATGSPNPSYHEG